MRQIINNWIYRLLIKLTDHKDTIIDEKEILNWLASNYSNKGFQDWLTNKYASLSKYLLGSYRGDEKYKEITYKMTVLRTFEKECKNAAELLEKKK